MTQPSHFWTVNGLVNRPGLQFPKGIEAGPASTPATNVAPIVPSAPAAAVNVGSKILSHTLSICFNLSLLKNGPF